MTPPRPRSYVGYYRVSTARQGRSGLGLEAQKAAVRAHLEATGGLLRQSFTEVQSGSDDDRPQLQAALKACRMTRSTLLIAKLDRLSRNAAFLLTLQAAGVRFVAADQPEVSEVVVGVLAVMAQAERQAISDRTKAALAAAKARGVQLGNPRLKPGTKASAKRASKAAQVIAKARAEEFREAIEDARSQGCQSLRELAAHLNDLGATTPRGGTWAAASVSRLLVQLAP
jgi:DNA invertase Pin-like site-specific DNA recombinase